MNSVNLEELYEAVSRLLYDVSYFLQNEIRNGTMSPEAQQQAKKLIDQSQKQCKNLVTASNLGKSRSYVQMAIKPGIAEEENPAEYVEADNVSQPPPDEEENYELPASPPTSMPSAPISEIAECPYTNSTANQLLDMAIKYGSVFRKERFLIIEQKKLISMLLIEHWLIIYPGQKMEVKPIMTIDLSDYMAIEKKDMMFEISSAGQKSYEFIARNYKDMMQWLVAINYKKISSSTKSPDSVSLIDQNSIEETSRTNSPENPTQEADEEVEEIYENVEEIRERTQIDRSSVLSTDSDSVPTLPPRKPPSESAASDKRSTSSNEYNNLQNLDGESLDAVYEETQEEELAEYDELAQSEPAEEEEDVEYHEPDFAKMKSDYATREALLSNDEELAEYDELLDIPETKQGAEEEELYDDLAFNAAQRGTKEDQEIHTPKQLKQKKIDTPTNGFSFDRLFRKSPGKLNPPPKNVSSTEPSAKPPKEENNPRSNSSSQEDFYDELAVDDKNTKKVEAHSFSSELVNKLFGKSSNKMNSPTKSVTSKLKQPQEENMPESNNSSEEELYDDLASSNDKEAKPSDSTNGFNLELKNIMLNKSRNSMGALPKPETMKPKEPKRSNNESEEELYDDIVHKEQPEEKNAKKIPLNNGFNSELRSKILGKSAKTTYSSNTEPPPPKLTLALEERKSSHESSEEELYIDCGPTKEVTKVQNRTEKGVKKGDSMNYFNVESRHKLLRKSPNKLTAVVRTEPPSPKILAPDPKLEAEPTRVNPYIDDLETYDELAHPVPVNALAEEELHDELAEAPGGPIGSEPRQQLHPLPQTQPKPNPKPPPAQLERKPSNLRTFGNTHFKSNSADKNDITENQGKPKLTPKPACKPNVADRFLKKVSRPDNDVGLTQGNAKSINNIIQQMEYNFKAKK